MATIPLIMAYRSLSVAKGLSPYKTGNYRHNAIHLKNVKSKSFTIHYSGTDAYYIKFVEDGTKTIKARHTIRNTATLLSQMFVKYYSGESFNSQNLMRRALATSKNTPERDIQHMSSIMYKFGGNTK